MGSATGSDPKKKPPIDSLVDLDDPAAELDEVSIDERAPDTTRPDFAPDDFAHHVESAEQRMTQPPSPTYDMLRDSCKTAIAGEVPLDEEQILRPSSRKQRIPDR